MDKKAIMGVVFTAIGVAGGVMLATFVSEKIKAKANGTK
tara:strand:+ start:266 stop:382 length:117 start_codon:yes stop_codon:yes gene_type:complete